MNSSRSIYVTNILIHYHTYVFWNKVPCWSCGREKNRNTAVINWNFFNFADQVLDRWSYCRWEAHECLFITIKQSLRYFSMEQSGKINNQQAYVPCHRAMLLLLINISKWHMWYRIDCIVFNLKKIQHRFNNTEAAGKAIDPADTVHSYSIQYITSTCMFSKCL